MTDVAIEDEKTRRAWRRLLQRVWGRQFVCLAFAFGIVPLPIITDDPVHPGLPEILAVWALGAVAVAAIWRAERRRERIHAMRRILATYGWQEQPLVQRVAPQGRVSYELPDPERPGKSVGVVIRGRLTDRLWARAVTEGAVEQARFAGDPRFGAVLALPGPRRLTLVRPRHAFHLAPGVKPRNVSDAAWAKAHAARLSH